jgi:hypothetical protein
VNENNLAIANTQSGVGTLTDVIAPVTFAQGKIDVTNGSTAISGVGTNFNQDFKVGQFLFYYDYTGSPALVGKIANIASATSLTLTTEATINLTSVNCGMANTVVGGRESVLIRIPTVFIGESAIIPNWSAYRDPDTAIEPTSYNDSTTNSLVQYSDVNSPQTAATPPLVNVPYTITPVYNFQSYETIVSGQKVTRLWQSKTNFPQFCFAIFDPYGDSGNPLVPNTIFKLFASESFPLNGVQVTTAYNPSYLKSVGY